MDGEMAEMPPPEELGAFFAQQYYGLLSAQPNHMHHFYSEHSTMILVINGDTRTTASDLDQIHNLIISLNFVSVEIKSVHSRECWGCGVLVVVSGYVKISDVNGYNQFVHTMYLAPQGTGFFILNDIIHIINHLNIIRHVKPVAPLKLYQIDPRFHSEHPPPATDNGNLEESMVKTCNDLMSLMVNQVEFPELKRRQPPPRRRGRFDLLNQPVVREIPYVEDEPTLLGSWSVGNARGDAMNENVDEDGKVEEDVIVEEEASRVSYSAMLSLPATSTSRGRGNNQRGRGRSSGDSEDKGNQEAEENTDCERRDDHDYPQYSSGT